jgi:hypothetical protein
VTSGVDAAESVASTPPGQTVASTLLTTLNRISKKKLIRINFQDTIERLIKQIN